MMLDKKQIQEIFLCEFERGHKQWWQLATSTIHLTQELLTDLQWSGASASFAKESRALKMRSRAAGHWKLTTIDWELSIIETDSLTVTREVAEELNIDHSKVVWHLKQIGMVKNLIAGCLVSWLQIKKKKSSFWSVFSYSMQQQWTISWLDCDMWWKLDFIPQPSMTSSVVDQEVPKHFPKPDCTKRRSWSLFGGLLPVWSTTAFWILAKSLCLRSTLSKSMRCTEIYSACGWSWSIERAQFISTTKPDHTLHSQQSNFLQGKCFRNQQDVGHAFQESVISQSMCFYTTGINKLFSLAKICWL